MSHEGDLKEGSDKKTHIGWDIKKKYLSCCAESRRHIELDDTVVLPPKML